MSARAQGSPARPPRAGARTRSAGSQGPPAPQTPPVAARSTRWAGRNLRTCAKAPTRSTSAADPVSSESDTAGTPGTRDRPRGRQRPGNRSPPPGRRVPSVQTSRTPFGPRTARRARGTDATTTAAGPAPTAGHRRARAGDRPCSCRRSSSESGTGGSRGRTRRGPWLAETPRRRTRDPPARRRRPTRVCRSPDRRRPPPSLLRSRPDASKKGGRQQAPAPKPERWLGGARGHRRAREMRPPRRAGPAAQAAGPAELRPAEEATS